VPTPAVAAVNWAELRAKGGEGEAGPLEDLLRIWCESTEVDGAALYLAVGDSSCREAVYGSTDFPESLSDAKGFGRVELDSSTLLFTPPISINDFGPLELLVAQGAEIRQLRKTLRRQNFQDSYRLVELEAIYELGLAIASTLDLEQLSEEILLRAVSLCDARRGALYVLGGEALVLRNTIGGDARRELELSDGVVEELLAAEDGGVQDVLPGAEYPLAVAIEIDGTLRGLLAVADKESRQGVGPFAEADRRTLGLFANQAAIALENARLHQQALEKERLEGEMELAAEIQQRLLPKDTPTLPGFELAGWNCPARQVGGDYYGYLGLGNGRLGLIVADVTGKGVPAALLVSILHSALRLLLDGSEVDESLFSRLNEHIVDSSSPNKFITLILVELDPKSGELRFLNAGHNPGILLRGDDCVVELASGGMPLGLLSGSSYSADSLEMRHGDLLCLYSDGITECESPEEGEFGIERLQDLLFRVKDEPLPEILTAIESTMRQFGPQGDDQTVVLLRRCV